MNYNRILNRAKLEESKNVVKMYEAKYYDALTETLQLMDESEQIFVLSRMDEKALFNSMASQVKKMNKQVVKAQTGLNELKNVLKEEINKSGNKDEGLIKLSQDVDVLLKECEDILAKLNDANFVGNYTKIDNNTGLFGKNKGNGMTSKDF